MSLYKRYKEDGGQSKSAYNPNLASKDAKFQSWYRSNTIEGKRGIAYSDALDYDYYSFYKNGEANSYKGGHFPDTYKRPNHSTFSDESIYSVPENTGGHWSGEKFTPAKKAIGGHINDDPKKIPGKTVVKKDFTPTSDFWHEYVPGTRVTYPGDSLTDNQITMARVQYEKDRHSQSPASPLVGERIFKNLPLQAGTTNGKPDYYVPSTKDSTKIHDADVSMLTYYLNHGDNLPNPSNPTPYMSIPSSHSEATGASTKYIPKRLADGGSLADQNAKSSQALGIGEALPPGIGTLVSTVQQFGTSIADAIDPPNEYGHQKLATDLYKGGQQGGALGAIAALVKHNKGAREEKITKQKEAGLAYNYAVSKYAAKAAADPTIETGIQGEQLYGDGGNLHSQYLQKKMGSKGSLSRISSDTVEVKGPSHAQGGVDLNTGDEVEGGETIKDSYVMSKKNGFADLHKPLAKAIGILEKKAVTLSTTNSLQRLRDKEDALILFQEQYNQAHNL